MGEQKRRVGPTGEFPAGMIRADDHGGLNIVISDADSQSNIHIYFGVPVDWIALPRDQVIVLARMLLRKAGAKKVEIIL